MFALYLERLSVSVRNDDGGCDTLSGRIVHNQGLEAFHAPALP
jgi:hypothetical protein